MVQPDISSGERDVSIVHLDSILRAAHLLPVYGSTYPLIPSDFQHTRSLDSFNAYYVHNFQLIRLEKSASQDPGLSDASKGGRACLGEKQVTCIVT